MTHLSLFSGIGGFDLGFELAGIETVAQVENNAFCLQVLHTHWPEVPKHEDIGDFDGSDYRGVNVISGGFPCQGLSVAGRRAGLADARSGLFFEMCRVVGEARPEFVVWENVPGLLSSNGGEDFATVLGTLADLGYHGAWRIMDSQFFGVAQRRRRVFGVFARGDIGWRSAAAVLLEPEGGGWHPEEGRKTGEDVAHSLDSRSGGDSGKEQQRTFVPDRATSISYADRHVSQREDDTTLVPEVTATLRGFQHGWSGQHNDTNAVLVFTLKHLQDPEWGPRPSAGSTPTLQADTGATGNNALCVASPEANAPGVREAPGLPRGLDSARYRSLGNAVTVNVAYWIGCRLLTSPEFSATLPGRLGPVPG